MALTFKKIEAALGIRDRTHRHRIAKQHRLPIGTGDQVPDWETLAGEVFQRMLEYGERPETTDKKELDQQKIREEIKYKQTQQQKLELEIQTKQGRMVDVNELKELQTELANCIRKAGDLMGRKSKLTGRDAQQILNKTLDEFYKLLKERLPKSDSD